MFLSPLRVCHTELNLSSSEIGGFERRLFALTACEDRIRPMTRVINGVRRCVAATRPSVLVPRLGLRVDAYERSYLVSLVLLAAHSANARRVHLW